MTGQLVYGYQTLRQTEPNVKTELDANDVVVLNNIGFTEGIRGNYFLSRLIVRVDFNQTNQQLEFTFADGSVRPIELRSNG